MKVQWFALNIKLMYNNRSSSSSSSSTSHPFQRSAGRVERTTSFSNSNIYAHLYIHTRIRIVIFIHSHAPDTFQSPLLKRASHVYSVGYRSVTKILQPHTTSKTNWISCDSICSKLIRATRWISTYLHIHYIWILVRCECMRSSAARRICKNVL